MFCGLGEKHFALFCDGTNEDISVGQGKTVKKAYLAPNICCVGFMHCNEDSATTLQNFTTEKIVVAHTNGDKTMLFLKATNFHSCIA